MEGFPLTELLVVLILTVPLQGVLVYLACRSDQRDRERQLR